MQSSAEERSIEAHIEAKSLTEAKKNLQEADVILIGPQIRYELENVKSLSGDVPVAAIDMRDYGMMNWTESFRSSFGISGGIICLKIWN